MIKIISDTLSSIPVDVARESGIAYLPQVVIFGEESFLDDSEITPTIFLKKLKIASSLPKTAAPPPELYKPIFEKIALSGDTGIVLCPSSGLSGTFRSATVAAGDFPGIDIRILDTQTIGSGLGSIVFESLKWIKKGLGANEIFEKAREMSTRNFTYFVVDTMEYLHKGGRIGTAKALLGSLLQIKPILQVKEGIVQPADTQRTKNRAISRITEIVASECASAAQDSCITIMHGDAEEDANKLSHQLSNMLNIQKIPIFEVPPAILVHSGPGVVAVSYFKT